MEKPLKVLIAGNLPGDAERRLSAFADTEVYSGSLQGNELIERLAGKDAIVCQLVGPITKNVIDLNPQLKLIANVAVGYDNIDVEYASQQGILVLNTPGVLNDSTADIAFALMISTARRIVEADKFVRSGQWDRFRLDLMLGLDLAGKTVGIVGFGRIGQTLARRCLGFDMKIVYHQRNKVDSEIESRLNAKYLSLDELLSTSDFISLHCPLTSATHHLIDEKAFSSMKQGAILVNTARGPVVDEQALILALQSGKLFGAGLDVYENEPKVPPQLLEMNNVVLLPHIGSATNDTRAKMAELAADGLIAAFSGNIPVNVVNNKAWPDFIKRLDRT